MRIIITGLFLFLTACGGNSYIVPKIPIIRPVLPEAIKAGEINCVVTEGEYISLPLAANQPNPKCVYFYYTPAAHTKSILRFRAYRRAYEGQRELILNYNKKAK